MFMRIWRGVSSVGGKNHLNEKSAFRPCGRDLVEFFNNTHRALYGPMKGKHSQALQTASRMQRALTRRSLAAVHNTPGGPGRPFPVRSLMVDATHSAITRCPPRSFFLSVKESTNRTADMAAKTRKVSR
jgi:hypothetical protein